MVVCGTLVVALADDFEGVGTIGVEGLGVWRDVEGWRDADGWCDVTVTKVFEDTKIKEVITLQTI